MEKKINNDMSGGRGEENKGTDPNAKERDRKGTVQQATDPESFDDEYETEADDEITRDEARSEKDNRPGKS